MHSSSQLRLAGESAEEVARSLGRSRRWVSKWLGRHQPGSPEWAEGGKRGPKRAANRTPAPLETQVLAVRERLVANPWAQIGAEAIAWELEKLGVEPPPSRTIEQILARGGASGRPRRERRTPKGVPYPAVEAARPGDLHEADLVGLRHLEGGVRFYALNAIDRASHRCGIEIVENSSDERIASALVALGSGSGCPCGCSLTTAGPSSPHRGSAWSSASASSSE